jgi:predicted CopG family antitoxin
MEEQKTTITIYESTWLELIRLKTKPKETMDDIIKRLVKEKRK